MIDSSSTNSSQSSGRSALWVHGWRWPSILRPHFFQMQEVTVHQLSFDLDRALMRGRTRFRGQTGKKAGTGPGALSFLRGKKVYFLYFGTQLALFYIYIYIYRSIFYSLALSLTLSLSVGCLKYTIMVWYGGLVRLCGVHWFPLTRAAIKTD